MNSSNPRRRLSIALRGDALPAPTYPSLSATPPPPPLVAFLASLAPPHAPSPSVLAATVLHAAQMPLSADRIRQTFATYNITLDGELCDHILALASHPSAGQSAAATDLAHWNDHASAVFSATAVAAGAAKYVTTSKREESIPTQGSNAGARASSSKDGPTDASWLMRRMSSLAVVEAGGALSASEMALSVVSLLADGGRSDEEIQGDLFDAFGGDFEAVVEVLGKRAELVAAYDQILRDCTEDIGEKDSREDGRGKKARRCRRTREEDAGADGIVAPVLGGNMFQERERYFPGVQVEKDTGIGAVDRVGLPKGSTREVGKGYEEIFVPPPSGKDAYAKVPLVDVKDAFREHIELLQAMKGVERLNRLQSVVFPVAFKSAENLLVCAPTGAGKTNVALLTIFREIMEVKMRMKRAFKVVYVAPMKALAAEVTEKFGKRLHDLGLKVREFTGDMSLTRHEALETHVLVTTPEKWDVVTRKSGSELGDAVTLFIVDEIHLLHDDRGAVLESIVARTLRLSETAQRQIRLVGLSATLPNYADVGAFMRVNPQKGLFHFDASHRPVPLSQTFIGISEGGQSNSTEARRRRDDKMHEMAWKKVKDSLQRGHQAMIFVHSRKGTSNAAREMLSRAAQDGVENIFLGGESKSKRTENGRDQDRADIAAVIPSWATKEISKSKTADIRELCARGIGIHNAGLPRVDRRLVEKLFAEGLIRLLCCTATLAWGVNLPARTVVIMGTEVYDAEKGGFVQLGMLDVMQIFGRAGRPQFDTEGEGTIITMHEHLGKYLNLLVSSIPIESQLGSSASRLADHLNAEIVSGTVSSIGEGVRWLSYTYLSVRMPQNPLVYGIDWAEVEADSGLHSRRATLIEQASKALDDARMCRYDPRSGVLAPTDLGRVASHFYVSHETVVLWNELLGSLSLRPTLTDIDWEEIYATVLHAVSCATEFEQMRSRQEESEELDSLTRQACPIPLKSGSETREGKVAVLLQAYISRAPIRMSDLSYVVQSSTRLLRALFEISLRRGLPGMSLASLELARASESRIWPFQHPLWQFTYSTRKVNGLLVTPETVSTIESSGDVGNLESLKSMTKEDLSNLIRAPKMVSTVLRVAKAVPTLEIVQAKVAPLNRTVLYIEVSLFPSFRWNEAVHGNAESWWMWLEDHEEDRVYHSQRILLTKRQVRSMNNEPFDGAQGAERRALDLSFSAPVFDPPSSQYFLRVESEHWHTGSGTSAVLNVSNLTLPEEEVEVTRLLDLRPLPLDAALSTEEALIFPGISHLKPLQTQAFHIARCSTENMLISAPAGSGKGVVAELAVLQALQARPKATVVCIEPDHNSLLLREKNWQRFKALVGGKLQILDSRFVCTGTPPFQDVKVLLTTHKTWCRFASTWNDESIAEWVSLFVVTELHLLRNKEHLGIELVVSRLRNVIRKRADKTKQYPRLVGLCEAMPNAGEFADWLGVDRHNALFSFDENVRQVPCESHVIGVAGDRYTSRMHSMNRTLFSMIQRYSPRKPVLIYVSSKRQTLQTAQDLIRLASINSKRGAFLDTSGKKDRSSTKALRDISDSAVQRCVNGGIGLYHDSMSVRERESIECLYRTGHIQVMIATFNMVRSFSVPSHLVIVKGTESYRQNERRYEDIPISDILCMIGQAGRPVVDSVCYSIVFVHEPKKNLFKKLLHESLPVESSLHHAITKLLLDEISLGRAFSVGDCVEYLSWTFLFQRLKTNPGYYGQKTLVDAQGRKRSSKDDEIDDASKWCSEQALNAVKELLSAGCIIFSDNGDLQATALGQLCVAHNINFRRVKELSEKLTTKCKGFEGILMTLSSMDEVVNLLEGIDEDAAWTVLAETICDQFCERNMYPNREMAAKQLGITQCNESVIKRARVACYSMVIDGLAKIEDFGFNRKEVHKAIEQLLTIGFEIVTEGGKLSLALEAIRISQALYQGLIPTNEFWVRCGYWKEEISAKGREADFLTMDDVRKNEAEFNVFLAKNCDHEAQRGAITRWLARRPRLNIRAQRDFSTSSQIIVNIESERALPLSHEGVETLSRLTRRRIGGFVVVVGSLQTDKLYSARRISEDGRTLGKYSVYFDIGSSVAEEEELHVWVMSDIDMGVEADALVV